MIKHEFLNDRDVITFCNWLGEVISCDRGIHFRYQGGTDPTLIDAQIRYRWPNKRIDILPGGELTIYPHSNFAENAIILEKIGRGLRRSLESSSTNPQELCNWLRATFVWGGVFTKRGKTGGNAGWLKSLNDRQELTQYWTRVRDVLAHVSDDDIGLELDDLRSNAGTTKVHSLLLTDWVIYDSRVAAALAWLVFKWSSGHPPPLLQFACMRPNTKKQKSRSPDQRIFKYFAATRSVQEHRKHLKWNIRANWILRAALDAARKKRDPSSPPPFASLREIESALFMVGDDLSLANGLEFP